MKVYDYVLVNKKDNKILERAFIREDARQYKNLLKEAGYDCKIVQRKYILQEQREVR